MVYFSQHMENFLFSIVMLTITVVFLFGLARFLDKITLPKTAKSITWTCVVLSRILENPNATALYYGLRWLGLCFIGHGFLSRFI